MREPGYVQRNNRLIDWRLADSKNKMIE